ncbi:hypothetical protein SCG7086_AA_00760 [Chlamydiales bacterium SCGC AG-110-P3]|nr:hypothetical protein SCG7086_AA_00760 [Chlamydiales bacterium SCGC AG-110-P3]
MSLECYVLEYFAYITGMDKHIQPAAKYGEYEKEQSSPNEVTQVNAAGASRCIARSVTKNETAVANTVLLFSATNLYTGLDTNLY